MRAEFLCISVLRVALGPRVKLTGCKSALTSPRPPPCPLPPRWFILLTVLRRWSRYVGLILCCFVVYSTRRFVLSLASCLFFCFSVLLALRLPRLGKREIILVLFVCFAFVWFCLFVWEGLRLVIKALPGLFSYHFCKKYSIR